MKGNLFSHFAFKTFLTHSLYYHLKPEQLLLSRFQKQYLVQRHWWDGGACVLSFSCMWILIRHLSLWLEWNCWQSSQCLCGYKKCRLVLWVIVACSDCFGSWCSLTTSCLICFCLTQCPRSLIVDKACTVQTKSKEGQHSALFITIINKVLVGCPWRTRDRESHIPVIVFLSVLSTFSFSLV